MKNLTKNDSLMVLSYIIGVNEASLITGLSTGYIKNLCAEGKIPAKKIGKTWIIDKRDIEKKG
ncbi:MULTISPECIES: helix-turn-helix domain-containing protein [Bacillus]|uniref:helix-turn-helix domain-containing protein n=1 Tax=Bacillus TaxID=1386 RepID=UPI00046A65C7|nr:MULTISPECIES: helix-turn-helix domain-containing protein [Bacillus]